jgi:MFS family permease
MSSATSQYNRTHLFMVSSLALTMAGIGAATRASTGGDLQTIFFDPIDPLTSAGMLGTVLGVPFLGFALTIAIGSPLLDYIGMKWMLPMSGVCFTVGAVLMIFAGNLASGAGVYDVIWYGAAVTGMGWGLVETVVNPLIAALYPDDKTEKLNVLHAWWPAGLVIGGLLGATMGSVGISWQIQLALVILPAIGVVVLCLGVKFPPTERAAAGIPARDMFRELLNPLFFILFLSMFLTAASELAPGQWVDFALSNTVGMPGILLLVYVSGLMFVMRHFAGALVHRLSPIGVLWFSSVGASLGLVALSFASSPVTGLLAATLWGTGVCYMWPTMLATASERFPRGGALLMGLMGTAGTLSIQFVLPMMGVVYDNRKIEVAGGEEAFNVLAEGSAELNTVLDTAAQTSFRYVAALPAILIIVFGAIWLYDRSMGGYKPKKLT